MKVGHWKIKGRISPVRYSNFIRKNTLKIYFYLTQTSSNPVWFAVVLYMYQNTTASPYRHSTS